MLPQSQALEALIADKRQGKARNGLEHVPVYNIVEGRSSQDGVTSPVMGFGSRKAPIFKDK